MNNFLRYLQTFFPFLQDLKFSWRFFRMKSLNKPHENDFHAVSSIIPESDEIFVDIGANRGESMLSTLLMTKENVRIVGFEPNKIVYDKLNRFLGDVDRVQIHNMGLSDQASTQDLYIPFYGQWMFDGLSSFDLEEASDWLRTRMWNYKEKHLHIHKKKCELGTLDSFSFKPCFIKIDVQGFELQVLKGGEETLKEYKPILLIEAITPEIMNYLSDFGYEYYTYDSNQMQKGTGHLNTFCITSEKFTKYFS